jgi:phosphate/sulfate permease
MLAVWTASAAELSRYREFELGTSVAAVTAVTLTAERDTKTVHIRPALVQEVVWQPRYTTGAPVADRKSIDEIVFSFVDDRLFKMTVAYERGRTTGLTNADMIAALTELYGAPASTSVPSRGAADAFNAAAAIAEWRQGDVQMALRRTKYNESFSLVITSLSLNAIAHKAMATALVMDAREAPAREAALAKKRADELRQTEELTRTTNKKVFQP